MSYDKMQYVNTSMFCYIEVSQSAILWRHQMAQEWPMTNRSSDQSFRRQYLECCGLKQEMPRPLLQTREIFRRLISFIY